jgi:hypothetical protein
MGCVVEYRGSSIAEHPLVVIKKREILADVSWVLVRRKREEKTRSETRGDQAMRQTRVTRG